MAMSLQSLALAFGWIWPAADFGSSGMCGQSFIPAFPWASVVDMARRPV